MENLITGQSWSGQFPFKKRSGEIFTALVTKSPLYEEGELVGVVTVSSEAAAFNIKNMGTPRLDQDSSHAQHRDQMIGMKNIQSHPKPQITPASQIVSSVTNLVLIKLTFIFHFLLPPLYS